MLDHSDCHTWQNQYVTITVRHDHLVRYHHCVLRGDGAKTLLLDKHRLLFNAVHTVSTYTSLTYIFSEKYQAQ